MQLIAITSAFRKRENALRSCLVLALMTLISCAHGEGPCVVTPLTDEQAEIIKSANLPNDVKWTVAGLQAHCVATQ